MREEDTFDGLEISVVHLENISVEFNQKPQFVPCPIYRSIFVHLVFDQSFIFIKHQFDVGNKVDLIEYF